MRIITTAALGVTALILALVIYSVDQKSAVRPNVLVQFDPGLIDRITIENGSLKTVMEKKGGFWFFVFPEIDRVNSRAVGVLLDQLNHLSIIDRFTDEDLSANPELSEEVLGFGKEKAIHIELSGLVEKGGKERLEQKFTLGSQSPRSKTLYAKIPDQDGEVFVVDGNPRRFLETPLETIRDRRLLGVPVEGIVQMLINSSKGEIALQRKITPPIADWALVRPLKTWANKDKMDQLLADLSGLQIEEVVKGSEGDFKIPKPIQDDAVVIQTMVFGMEKPMTVFLNKKKASGTNEKDEFGPPLLEARVSDRPFTYLVRSNILKNIPATPDDLRDRHLARIPIQNLQSITIKSRIDPLVFLNAKQFPDGRISWDVYIGKKPVPANLGQIQSLVKGINETAILKFVSDSPDRITEYGLDPPARRISFKILYPGESDDDGKPGPPREVIRSLKLGWKEGDEQRLYANFDGEPYIYELDPTFVGLIPTHPIKWRSLKVLTFNSFHLREITREVTGKAKMELSYNYRQDIWEGKRGGDDVTSSLEIGSLKKLQERLSSFSASGWYLSLAQAYSALEKPSARITILTRELDPATNKSHDVKRVLKFARATEQLYFGQVEGLNDVFIIDSKKYGNLTSPVTSSRIQTP